MAKFLEYTENGSKNRSGSYKDKSGNKIVRHFADSSLGDRCYVSLVKTYLSNQLKLRSPSQLISTGNQRM